MVGYVFNKNNGGVSEIIFLTEFVPGFVQSTEHGPGNHSLLGCCIRWNLNREKG